MSERISGMTTLRCAAFFFFVAAWLGGARAGASPLPKAPLPAAPFPKIVTDAPTISFVAPGVTYGFYEMVTADGPLAVRVVAVDLHDPSVSLQTALASNELTSNGETVSAMAQRTGAVAGINGDYFDIGATNQPTNILVEDGSLLHLPRPRYALAVTARRTVVFKQFTFGATLQLPDGTYAQLDGVNALPPPEDGTSILTPEFGPVAPEQNLTLTALEPLGGTPPFARYRVTGIADNTVTQPPGYYLAVGLDAYGTVGALGAGSTIEAEDDTTPSLAGVVAAVGGGPLLVKDGMPYDDPDGPSGGGFADPIPCSGAAVTAAGTLLLFEVDGRQPALSIGLTRPQFAALMLAFGATEGMAFDGGGSSTLVARRLGYAGAPSPTDCSCTATHRSVRPRAWRLRRRRSARSWARRFRCTSPLPTPAATCSLRSALHDSAAGRRRSGAQTPPRSSRARHRRPASCASRAAISQPRFPCASSMRPRASRSFPIRSICRPEDARTWSCEPSTAAVIRSRFPSAWPGTRPRDASAAMASSLRDRTTRS
ncbi:MAG: phosphodiester glycosidase family protein [Vulcanimicrobiaceae bacterium]